MAAVVEEAAGEPGANVFKGTLPASPAMAWKIEVPPSSDAGASFLLLLALSKVLTKWLESSSTVTEPEPSVSAAWKVRFRERKSTGLKHAADR